MNTMIFPAKLRLTDPAALPAAGKAVGEVQSALLRLKVSVSARDLARKELGASTVEAVRRFQERAGLPADGRLTRATAAKLNAEVAHSFVVESKTRTQRVQDWLQEAGQNIAAEETRSRKFGPTTERAYKQFQAKLGVAQDGRITEDIVRRLREEALKTRLGSKTQVAQVHRTLLRALNIAKLKDVRVDASELKSRKIGASTQAAIKAVQTKYGLPVTGELNAATHDRLVSIASSIPQPVKHLKARAAVDLRPVERVLRLNTTHSQVNTAQGALAFLGYAIEQREFASRTFGRSTREAVLKYQRDHGLPQTGHIEGATLDSLNREVQQANPQAGGTEPRYHVRGAVRDERWRGMAGLKVQVWERLIGRQGAMLAERKTAGNGFFDIPYDPPREAATGQIKVPFAIEVRVLNANIKGPGGTPVAHPQKVLFNPTPIAWVNFTEGDQPYRGTSEWEVRTAVVAKAIQPGNIADLVETGQKPQISQVAQAAGLMPEDVLRLVLAYRLAVQLDHPPLLAEACYAFVGQDLPPGLPNELLDVLDDWTLIDERTQLTALGLVFMDGDLQQLAFESALALNLMPVTVGLQKTAILAALAQLKQNYALEKPILIGNGSLKALLDISAGGAIPPTPVATAFLQHKNLGPAFWADLKARPAEFGGAAAVQDFQTTVEVGQVTENFIPMVTLLKQKIADPNVKNINSARDLAKLTSKDWEDLINANGSRVPSGLDVPAYVAKLSGQSEQMFPAVALAARAKLDRVAGLLDTYSELDLRTTNINAFAKENGLDADTLTEARVAQRVHRIAPNAAAGQALLEEKIHNAAQIMAMGKERFAATLTAGNRIDRRVALTLYGMAEHQHAQVLQRIADYRFELHRANPRAIVSHTYDPKDLAGLPDWETLFGSLDFCDCPHCQSVYGPPAYLADVLRFLDTHESEVANKTVKDILFARRPDLGNLKLNCQNTETPLPYIDLVCEVLENAIPAPNPAPDFSFQTTRTAAELRAFPEHVRQEAYDTLKTADYPLHLAFNLAQEEARVFLDHLGVARWELMETLQAQPGTAAASPADASIAGEFWGLSTHETEIVTATNHNTAARQKTYWGFKTAVPQQMTVADFMRRSRLDYAQVLDLLDVQWLNPWTAANRMGIQRPRATCNTEEQMLVNLTVDRLDRIHRFLRLWRRTDWAMWELDLLLRAKALGSGRIDSAAVVRLKQFKQVQKRLSLTVEQALVLFGDINTEVRPRPDDRQREIDPLYTRRFLNPAVIKPVDERLALYKNADPHLFKTYAGPMVANTLSAVKPTLLAALALTEADLALLLARLEDDALTVANLSALGRHASLAQTLALRIKDLLALEDLSGNTDIFATPKATLDFIARCDWVAKSGFAVGELDYLLTHKLDADNRPDSPYALRDEVLAQHIAALREALRSNTADQPDGAIVAQVAATFALPPEQGQSLLDEVQLQGETLLDTLTDKTLLEKLMARDATGAYLTDITPANFPTVYSACRLLHKLALLLSRFKVTTPDLKWLLKNSVRFGLLDLNALPVTAVPAAPLFPAWLALCQWLDFKGLYPEPEDISWRAIFDLAGAATTPDSAIRTAIAKLTQWEARDVNDLAVGLGLQHGGAVSDYARVDTYVRLGKCVKQIKRIGAGASLVLAWAMRDDDAQGAQAKTAHQIRQAAKSKHDERAWLEKVAPLEDVLREKKRDALIGYLVETSLRFADPEIQSGTNHYPNPAYWRDANDLLSYFLIDVEMSACQLTSRIKQAIGSAQMFVQRCLLGLERPEVDVARAAQEDAASDNSWRQWKWMKSYRLWEANRKVFLYPENWIEPELRDDKSPFFKELEAEILQQDITDENVEAAFLHYIQKVHEVARLDIVGAYYELDDTDPRDHLPPDINRLHVIGRTRSQPAIYYYRQFDLNYGEWTAWEKIDLDIQSDQVIPVVYNRHLYLFWLQFIEKPQKVKKQPPAKPSDNPTDTPEPPHQLEIQLAWSARKDGGWTAQRVSAQKLIHPWQRPVFSYNLKPRYKSRENLLWLDIYISQSQQFNNTRFWDPYGNALEFVTAQRWNETTRPWHSSSFVFDGDIVEVKLKGLAGQYHVLSSSGQATDRLTDTSSYVYVHDNFGEPGRAINRLSGPYEIAPRLPLPDGMHYHNTRLANNKRTLNAGRANVLEHGHTRTLLNAARSPFEIVFSQHHIAFDTAEWGPVPFFYQDSARAFFIRPEWQQVMIGYNKTLQTQKYTFYPFYHPYAALFMRELNRSGLSGLLNRRIQIAPDDYYPANTFDFTSYRPAAVAVPDKKTAQKDTVDFERYGAYSIYNWEIFFHAPLLIACKLSANQRFDEAMRWFHTIFDPTNTDSPDVPQRYWITRPFFEQNSDDYRRQRIENLLQNIDLHKDELAAWKNNPFKPHRIARYRPVAYQKAVVMKYLDNLIAWGDQLFRRDTIEAINEATTLYVLAYELLGRRPVKVPNVERAERSYRELTAGGALDAFGNKQVVVAMENFTSAPVWVIRRAKEVEPLPTLQFLPYFGLPNNDRMLGYWNTIEDRLFKIRHCMNIMGVVRQLPLFEPPIDPALLVKAAAAGVDLDSVLVEVTTAPSPYRFQRLAQKAAELSSEVRALGDKMLAALEKYDAEGLALLRSSQEIRLLQAVREVRKRQIEEANDTWAGLEKSKELALQKKAFYEGREFMNAGEAMALTLGAVSAGAETAIAVGYILAGGLTFIPKFVTGASGFGGSPHVTVEVIDGFKFSRASELAVQTLGAIARAADKIGSLASTVGSFQRRQDEWTFQAQLASTEIAQIDRQILAARVRLAIAEKELENHELQIEQSQAVDEYLRNKYTHQQLYDWQLRQVASLYFQSYQLAYDMAKRAERSFRFELGDAAARYVQFGYWDSLKKGLLAGERLANDIHRMEAAYLEQNTRDLEITKHISLADVLPLSLLALKAGGACTVTLPEWLFDLDYPGHYRRRIKSVSISIPCVVGPYTSVNCTLALTRNSVRVKTTVAAPDAASYGDALDANDDRFDRTQLPPITAIATSHCQNDSGMFELNFNDERFLPFEGAGAVSEWRIELPQANNQFDLATISDVVLHLRYTALPSGDTNLVKAANANLAVKLPGASARLIALNREFGTAWHRLLHPEEGAEQTLSFGLGREHLPFYVRGKANIRLTGLDLIIEGAQPGSFDVRLTTPGAAAADSLTTSPLPEFGGAQHAGKTGFLATATLLGEWQMQIKKAAAGDFKSLKQDEVRNAYLVVGFSAS